MLDLLRQYVDWVNGIDPPLAAVTVVISSIGGLTFASIYLLEVLYKAKYGPSTIFILLAAYFLWAWWVALFGQGV